MSGLKNNSPEVNDILSWLVEYHKRSLTDSGRHEAHDVIFKLIRDLCDELGGDSDGERSIR